MNTSLEMTLLSSILFEPRIIEEIAGLEPYHFTDPYHSEIFSEILNIHSEGLLVDETILVEKLRKKNLFHEERILAIITANPVANIGAYVKQIREAGSARNLQQELKRILIEQCGADEIIQRLEQLQSKSLEGMPKLLPINTFEQIEEKEAEYFLREWLPIPKGAITLVSGRGGDGKSMLLIQAGLRFAIENPDLKACLWLSEDPASITKHRARSIASFIEIDDVDKLHNLNVIGNDLMPPHFIAEVGRGVEITKEFYRIKAELQPYKLIILDPLIAYYGADENSNGHARMFMNLLNEWAQKEEKSIIIIHHHSKAKDIRGAGAFRDAARLHYQIEVPDDQPAHRSNFRQIYIEKDNWGVRQIMQGERIERQFFKHPLIPVEVIGKDPKPSQKQWLGRKNKGTIEIPVI